MQDVGIMLHLNVASQLPLLYVHPPVSYLLPRTKMLRQFPFGIDPSKISPVIRTKAEKPDMHFPKQSGTYVKGPKTCTTWPNYALD